MATLNYFDYQQSGLAGGVWSLFAGLKSVTEEEKLKKSSINVSYAHSLEIISAAFRGSLLTDEESLESFDLRAYEYKCAENDSIGKIQRADKELYIVDTTNSDKDEKVGFGDVTEREKRLQCVDEAFDKLESIESLDSDIKALCNIRGDYLVEHGVDLVSVLVNSLKGIPDAVEELRSLLALDSSLSSLVSSLCENGSGSLMTKLEFVL